MGLTTGGSIGVDTAKSLDDCVALAEEWAHAVPAVREDVVVLVHVPPVAEPSNAQYVLTNAPSIDGFYGASSMKRLPTERALVEQVQRFTALELGGALRNHLARP